MYCNFVFVLDYYLLQYKSIVLYLSMHFVLLKKKVKILKSSIILLA